MKCYFPQDHPSIIEDLDLVDEENQYTHLIPLEEATNGDDMLS